MVAAPFVDHEINLVGLAHIFFLIGRTEENLSEYTFSYSVYLCTENCRINVLLGHYENFEIQGTSTT